MQNEIFGPSRGGDDSVGQSFPEFRLTGTGFLRDREVFGQSIGAPYGHGAGHADEFPGLGVENFLVLEIQYLFSRLHAALP